VTTGNAVHPSERAATRTRARPGWEVCVPASRTVEAFDVSSVVIGAWNRPDVVAGSTAARRYRSIWLTVLAVLVCAEMTMSVLPGGACLSACRSADASTARSSIGPDAAAAVASMTTSRMLIADTGRRMALCHHKGARTQPDPFPAESVFAEHARRARMTACQRL
jgi:hypothetical protein